MRVAIIDLGTNTFNLLIVDKNENGFSKVFKTKRPVKLGQDVANTQMLCNNAMERGMKALQNHLNSIKKYKAEKVFAFATSAIRSCNNGLEYVNRIYNELGIDVNVISGEKEAELIYYGVKQAVDLDDEKVMIVDIGGGSIEVLIVNKNEIFWKQSFRLGIARLLDKFNPSDPISSNEIEIIEKYIDDNTQSLNEILKTLHVTTIIGSSGSIDTFARMISQKFRPAGFLDNKINFEINLEEYEILHNELLLSTIEERKRMKGLELMRVEMIVIASIFINFIIEKYNFTKLIQSDYALKEGVIATI